MKISLKNITKGVLMLRNNFFFASAILFLSTCNRVTKPLLKSCNSVNLSFVCSFDVMTVDSVLLGKSASIEYASNQDSIRSVFFTKFKEANSSYGYGFIDINDSILKNESFTLCVIIDGKKDVFKFENIIIDTIPIFGGYICGLKRYTVNNIEYKERNFVLPLPHTGASIHKEDPGSSVPTQAQAYINKTQVQASAWTGKKIHS